MGDLGEGPGGPGGPGTPLILGKKEQMSEGKMADRASKLRPPPPPPPLAKGLDPPQISYRRHLVGSLSNDDDGAGDDAK